MLEIAELEANGTSALVEIAAKWLRHLGSGTQVLCLV